MINLSLNKVINNLLYYLTTDQYIQSLGIETWRTFDGPRVGDEMVLSLFPYSKERSKDGSISYKNTEIGGEEGMLVTYRVIIQLQYNGRKEKKTLKVDKPKRSLVDFQETYESKVEIDTSLPVLLEGLELISLVLMNMPNHKKSSYGISSINPVSINFFSTPWQEDQLSQRKAELLLEVETSQRRSWKPSQSYIEEININLKN